MDKFKEAFDVIDEFGESVKKEFKQTFPDTPEDSPQKGENFIVRDAPDDITMGTEGSDTSEDDSRKRRRKGASSGKNGDTKQGLFSGVKSFFKISKKEEKQRKELSTKSKKLPKNFANRVLDLELKVDIG